MTFESINPYNNELIGSYKAIDDETLEQKIQQSAYAFRAWGKRPLVERTALITKAGQVLRDNTEEYARMITLEMGKPITESRAEIEKCAWVCDYYAEHAAQFLQDEVIKTDAQKSFVRHDPLGSILAIMPWNFPFWQVFRFAAPTLTAGNTALLKHAPNVFGCARLIEDIFLKAGFPADVFQTLLIHHDKTEKILSHKDVKAVSLTGSAAAGRAVASLAGKHLKKSLLELGGSNAFIVLEDADLEQVVETAVNARMLNAGQSCIAAKRFILLEGIYEQFVAKYIKAIAALPKGNPLDEATKVGPLARLDLADKLQQQVQQSISKGAKLVLGGKQEGYYHEPTILTEVKPGMPAFDEETFGPLTAIIKAKSIEEAFEFSEQSDFGLGVTVCTGNTDKAIAMAGRVSDGAYFINELVKSDPRLPFGGTKTSGYGRELSKDGILEFVNRKVVYVK